MPILVRNATVATPSGHNTPRGPQRGPSQRDVQVLRGTDVLCEGDTITAIGAGLSGPTGTVVVEAGGRLLTPGLIDCHTHACWAGSRIDEWERKLAGATYLEIMAAGGGIMSTVRAVRTATQAELAAATGRRLHAMLAAGTTTAEVKSGYGLGLAEELKMLRAIGDAARKWPGTVVPTALLGHAIDPETPEFVPVTIAQTLPAVSREFPGIAVDAFCEKGAWSPEECLSLFAAAQTLGHPIRMHIDQFTAFGMIAHAVRLGARSVDHLEASTPEGLEQLGASGVIGVGLPVCGLHVDGRYANLRRVVDAGGAVAVASNANPGSAPNLSMPLAMGLAVRHCGLTAAEAFVASTANAAAVLGMADRGRVAAGLRADLVLWNAEDYRELAYWIGGPGVACVISGGERAAGALG